MALQKNVGTVNRAIRIIVSIGLLSLVSLAFVSPKSPWACLGLIGILPLATGIIGHCPPYALLGINTCKADKV